MIFSLSSAADMDGGVSVHGSARGGSWSDGWSRLCSLCSRSQNHTVSTPQPAACCVGCMDG